MGPGVVTGRYGSVGSVFYVDEPFWPLNTTLYVKDFHGNEPKFVYYILSRFNFARFKDKTGVPGVNRNDLHKVPVYCPPVSHQRRVVALLDLFEATLRQTDRLVDAKLALKLCLMQHILTGRMRFPEFRSDPWHSSPLDKHVTSVTRRNVAGLSLVLTASGEHGLVDQRRYFSRRVAGADLTKYYLLRKGEFAYNRSAMIGYPFGATKRLDEHEAGALSTLYLCFSISDPDLDSDYLSYVFESGVLNRQLRPIARVGARAHGLLNVTDDDFFSVSIPLPRLNEQQRIAALLKLVDRELGLLRAQRDSLEQQQRTLQNKLLVEDIEMSA
jgi:type I restriction enzyme S subunit